MSETEIKVFETGCGKWVFIDPDMMVRYTANDMQATKFDLVGLRSARDWFEDFGIYKRTMYAVPIGTNQRPWDCERVDAFLSAYPHQPSSTPNT